jgi:hypothetical protein
VIVRDLEIDDASALTDLFHRCYGDTYGTRMFYDPPALTDAIRNGRLRSVVAVEDAQIVGHTGITVVHPQSLVCETGNTVVDPAMRGRGLLKELGAGLSGRVRREGFAGYLHYPTTAHEIMQHSSVRGGGVETGLMLAYVPDTTDYKGVQTRTGRIAATVAYQPFGPAPHRAVHVPDRYRDLIAGFYENIEYDRVMVKESLLWDANTELQAVSKSARGLVQFLVISAASDVVTSLLSRIRNEAADAAVIHVDLPMDCSWVEEVVEQLVNLHGFVFCSLLPEFQRCDLLRLQLLPNAVPADYSPDLVNTGALDILKLICGEAGAGAAD